MFDVKCSLRIWMTYSMIEKIPCCLNKILFFRSSCFSKGQIRKLSKKFRIILVFRSKCSVLFCLGGGAGGGPGGGRPRLRNIIQLHFFVGCSTIDWTEIYFPGKILKIRNVMESKVTQYIPSSMFCRLFNYRSNWNLFFQGKPL